MGVRTPQRRTAATSNSATCRSRGAVERMPLEGMVDQGSTGKDKKEAQLSSIDECPALPIPHGSGQNARQVIATKTQHTSHTIRRQKRATQQQDLVLVYTKDMTAFQTAIRGRCHNGWKRQSKLRAGAPWNVSAYIPSGEVAPATDPTDTATSPPSAAGALTVTCMEKVIGNDRALCLEHNARFV